MCYQACLGTDILFANRGPPALSPTVQTAAQGKGSNLVGSYPHSIPESHTKETQNMESGPKGQSSNPALILAMQRPLASPAGHVCFLICTKAVMIGLALEAD